MIKKFVHNVAVKSWQKELDNFIEVFEAQPKNKQADYFVYSTRTRAGMQIEGIFMLPDGTKIEGPELVGYPFMISQFEKIIKRFNQQGSVTEANSMSIWLHTVRGLLYQELRPSVVRMWDIIMETKNLWPEMLEHHYKLDKEEGMDESLLRDTYNLTLRILKTAPPLAKENH